MPIYEYRCEACNHEFDVMQRMSDDPLTECPECHAQSLRKLVSAAGFRLKGSGWYKTESKSGSKDAESKPSHTCGTGACPSCATD